MSDIDLKKQVMEKIQKENIKIKQPVLIWVEKFFWSFLLMLVALGGSLIVFLFFSFYKKYGAYKSLGMGFSGMKLFFSIFPWDYVLLFFALVLLAIYILKKIIFLNGRYSLGNFSLFFVFTAIISLGIILMLLGVEGKIKGWHEERFSEKIFVGGKILNINEKEVILRDSFGKDVRIIFNEDQLFPYKTEYAQGKFLRAIGQREEKDDDLDDIFRAKIFRCCDDD